MKEGPGPPVDPPPGVRMPLENVDPVCGIWSSPPPPPPPGRVLSNFRGGGAFEFLDLFLTSFGPFALWTFQCAAGFRGPGILIKRATIVDLLPRGSEVQISDKTSEKG